MCRPAAQGMPSSLRVRQRFADVGSGRRGHRYAGARGFVKQYIAAFESELEKAQALHRLSSECFYSPKPIHYDRSLRTIVFEQLVSLVSVRKVYLDFLCCEDSTNTWIFDRAGSALAELHARLRLTTRSEWKAPAIVAKHEPDLSAALLDTPHAQLHCDFGFSNVFIQLVGNETRLVILDASPNYFMTEAPDTFASVYLDLANFAACLDGLVPMVHYLRIDWQLAAILKGRFLDAYEMTSRLTLDRTLLQRVTDATARAYFSTKFRNPWLRRLAFAAMFWPRKRRELNIGDEHK